MSITFQSKDKVIVHKLKQIGLSGKIGKIKRIIFCRDELRIVVNGTRNFFYYC